jgi:oligosaccharide reducing-end xylanase
MSRTEKGWIAELVIPRTCLGVDPKVGSFIGFDAEATDTDADGKNKGKLTCFCPNGDAWKNPSLFGTAKLVE